MRVIVETSVSAREELVRLLEARTPSTGDAVRFAVVYLDDMKAEFHKYAGAPPKAVEVTGHGGGEWWWLYADGIWMEFRVIDRPGRLFTPAVRTIRVMGFQGRPPEP